uniref:Uncharacterized protein n=2 Tax=Anser TaxID=8842 RepID=A0A8B9BGS9_9AVES
MISKCSILFLCWDAANDGDLPGNPGPVSGRLLC